MQELAEQLRALGAWLEDHRALWAERPFVGLPVAWEADEPEVARRLRELPLEVVEAYEPDPASLPDPPRAYRRWAEACREWSRLPALVEPRDLAREGPPPLHVPGRKWAQIAPFAELAARRRPAAVDRWVDWCCGKGHLGRTLSLTTGLPFAGVERDEALCRQGANLTVGQGVSGSFVVVDVLEDDPADLLGPGAGVVALHACGLLHERLLRLADAARASFLALSPCCYHRHQPTAPRPMSEAARGAGLTLTTAHLRLVGLREVVATPRRAALRRREQAFRLGVDELRRRATGDHRYRSLGAARRAWIDLPFEEFARRLLDRAGVEPPTGVDWPALEARAWERLRLVRALAFVRGLFRGPLETWLLLDRACFLAERGWTVELGRFCDDRTTPRNAVVLGWR